MRPYSALGLFVFVLGLACAMYWSWDFVGPSGQTIDISSFFVLWFRELVILGLLILVLLYICFDRLRKRMRNQLSCRVEEK